MDVAIYPASAAATCRVNVSSNHIHEDGEIGADYYEYTFSATPGPAWEFDHFEAHMDFKTEVPWFDRQNWSGKIHTSSNPSNVRGWFKEDGSSHIYHCEAHDGTTWVEGETIESWTLTNVVAVFKQREDDYEIISTASVLPAAAENAGCSASVSPHISTGHLGESAHITFSAASAGKWEFHRWDDGSGDITHIVLATFGPEQSKTIHRVAEFRERQPERYAIFATAYVDPDEALEAGCTAGASPDVQYGDLGETGVVTYTANPAVGWQFTSWSDGSSDPVHSVEYEFGPELVKEVSLTATFERQHSPGIKFHVSTTMTPDKARGSTSGDGDYEEGERCGISAKSKCSPWIFDHWEFSTGKTYRSQSVSFTVYSDVTCTAFFRHANTGALLYDADGGGDLICSATGDLLYNGDNVA